MNLITEYTNATNYLIVVKQSNGSTYELMPQMKVKADAGTCFVAVKYPDISKKWHKLNAEKIRLVA